MGRRLGLDVRQQEGACDVGALCETLLDVLDIAVIVFDARGELVFSNRIAHHVLSDGATIHLIAGRLHGPREECAALVATARECAAGGLRQPPRCFRVARPERPPLILSLTSIRPPHPATSPLAVGVIQDPEARTVLDPGEIAERYGITPAEARVAAAVADGKVAKVIARELNIGPATVRSHLRSIYVKLGLANAKELIALLRGSVFHRAVDGGPHPRPEDSRKA